MENKSVSLPTGNDFLAGLMMGEKYGLMVKRWTMLLHIQRFAIQHCP